MKLNVRPTGVKTTSPKVKTPQIKPPRPVSAKPSIARADKTRIPRPVGNMPVISTAQKNANVEKKAITATRNKLYRTGFTNVKQVQHDGLHGVDLGAFKYSRDGKKLLRSAAVEVKGRSGRTPGPSAFQKQVRMSYIKPRLEKASNKGVKGADALLAKAKQGKLESFGATYGLKDKGKGPNIYKVPMRGPISRKPI